MPQFGKPDATGRSSGVHGGRRGKLSKPPAGGPWVWITRELLCSPSWRAMSTNTFRLISFLLIEHANHASQENGNLVATHEQLFESGLSKNLIRDAVLEAEFLGLIRYQRGGRWAGTNTPSRYRLTFYASADGAPASDEWRALTGPVIDTWKSNRASARNAGRRRGKGPNVVSIVGQRHNP